MYRVNLYREREAAEASARRRLVGAGILGAIIGLEVILVGFLAVSGALLRERLPVLEGTVRRAEAVVPAGPDPDALAVARSIVRLRSQRLDWAPCLAAISERLPDEIVLDEIRTGVRLDGNQRPGIDLVGRMRSRGGDLSSLLTYVDALRGDERIAARFPIINLDRSDAERTLTFVITCRTGGGS